jgi:hypothetical protein
MSRVKRRTERKEYGIEKEVSEGDFIEDLCFGMTEITYVSL